MTLVVGRLVLKRKFEKISPVEPEVATFGSLTKGRKTTVQFPGGSSVQQG